MSEKDFYMVLPSNACPTIHPNNTASNYTVSWQNPLDLTQGNWKVALTEAAFNRPQPGKLSEKFAIEYEWNIKFKKLFYYWLKFKIVKQRRRKEGAGGGEGNGEGEEETVSRIGDLVVENYYESAVDEFKKNITIGHFEVLPEFPDSFHSVFEHSYDVANGGFFKNWAFPKVIRTAANFFKLIAKHPFIIEFRTPEHATILGFSTNSLRVEATRTEENPNIFFVQGENPIATYHTVDTSSSYFADDEPQFPLKFYFTMEFYTLPKTVSNTKYVSVGKDYYSTLEDLRSYVAYDFEKIFDEVKLETIADGAYKGGKTFELTVKKGIRKLKFHNGFNIALGFRDQLLDIMSLGNRIRGQFPAIIDAAFRNLYIYSSICEPILVGGVRAPLLRSIWLQPPSSNNDQGVGEVCHVSVRNPMYVHSFASSINSIEINIRSDSGQLIPFADGSITSLTLHFKRVDHDYVNNNHD